MFESLQADLNNFGLGDAVDLWKQYEKKEEDKSSSQSSAAAQTYDQIQQQVSTSNKVTSPLDSKLIVYGGVGVVLLILFMGRR